MKTKNLTFILALMCSAYATGAAANEFCFYDSNLNGTGGWVKWDLSQYPSGIPYYINASVITDTLEKTKAIEAVKKAFSAWEITCTGLKFEFKGETTDFVPSAGSILAFWGNDALNWPFGADAYQFGYQFSGTQYHSALIGMNYRDFKWSDAGIAGAFDIQTTVMWLIAPTIGFFYGSNPATGTMSMPYGSVNHNLTQAHIDGAKFLYANSTDPSCAVTVTPTYCANWSPPMDGGATIDGPPSQLDGGVDSSLLSDQPALADSSSIIDQGQSEDQAVIEDAAQIIDAISVQDNSLAPEEGGNPSKDSAMTPPADVSDSGCCNVHQSSQWRSSIDTYLLSFLLLGLALMRQRRK